MLVGPGLLASRELLHMLTARGRVGDLGNQVGSRGFGNAVHEDTNEGNLDENVKSQAETEEHASAATKPILLLFFGKMNTREVGLEQLTR